MKNVLEVNHITKKFGSFTAVDGISFSVQEGEIMGLLGQNGAGKTTMISMLLGIIKPTTGYVSIFGKDMEQHRIEILNQVNYSSAYINFSGKLTVRENLSIFAMLYDVQDRKRRVEEVMELFDISGMAGEKYLYLSSGQQTRVHLAKAFLNHPKIIFLDEPTAALDPDIADNVRSLILDLQEKFRLTVLLTSHNMSEVEEVCDRVIFIDKGRIIAEDSPEQLAKKIAKTTVRLLIRDGLKRTMEYTKKHNFDAEIQGRNLAIKLTDEEIVYFLTFLAERNITYQEISIDKPTLEDYFLEQMRRKK